MQTEKKQRPWFQIHLSTAIVLMFATGALIGANVRPRVEEIKLPYGLTVVKQGWPFAFYNHFEQSKSSRYETFIHDTYSGVSYTMAIVDAVVALGLLAALATFCECCIRSKEKH